MMSLSSIRSEVCIGPRVFVCVLFGTLAASLRFEDSAAAAASYFRGWPPSIVGRRRRRRRRRRRTLRTFSPALRVATLSHTDTHRHTGGRDRPARAAIRDARADRSAQNEAVEGGRVSPLPSMSSPSPSPSSLLLSLSLAARRRRRPFPSDDRRRSAYRKLSRPLATH